MTATIVALARALRNDPRIGGDRRISNVELAWCGSRTNAVATLLLIRWLNDETGRGSEATERLLTKLSRPQARGELSQREWEVLVAASHGLTRRETAEVLGTGDETVKEQRWTACRRLGARNITHAVAIAIRRGLIE